MSKILKLEYFKLSKEIERLQKEESKLRKEAKELKSYNNKTKELINPLENAINEKKEDVVSEIRKEIRKRNLKLDARIHNLDERKETYNNKVVKIKDKENKFIEKLINTELDGIEECMVEIIFEVVKRYDLLKSHYWDRDKRNEIKKYILTEGTFNIFTDEEFAILEREIFQ